jgi:hypothetical protein
MSESGSEPHGAAEPEHHVKVEPEPEGAAVEPDDAGSEAKATPSKGHRLRRPTLSEIAIVVGLIGAVVALVFKLAPGCQPESPSNVVRAEISDVRPVHPFSFKRFLQRQQSPIPPDLTKEYLARLGVMVEFHYEIFGLSGKQLALGWELSDVKTNELVAAKLETYTLTPSKDHDAGDWSVWVPAPKPGRDYYVTVTIYKPEGPPYELKHVQTETFPGFPRQPAS